MLEVLRELLDSWTVTGVWAGIVALCLMVLLGLAARVALGQPLLIRFGVKSGMPDPREVARQEYEETGAFSCA